MTGPAVTWAFVAPRLAEKARIIVLDNCGRGLSDQRDGLMQTTGDYAEYAAGVIHELGVGPTIFVCHAMGARVAARRAGSGEAFLLRRPDPASRGMSAYRQ